jgi:equilibrative nucleoside transporter 1/2/3
MSPTPTPEKSRVLIFSFVLFGLAQLLPWNICIKSVPYFRAALGDYERAASISSWMSSSYTICNFSSMVMLVVLRWDELFLGTSSRIVIGMTGNAALMLLMAIVPLLNLSPALLFGVTVGLCGASGAVTACLIKGLFGMAARFPPDFTPPLMGGQAAAGLLVSAANLITTRAHEGPTQSPIGPVSYFITGATTLSLSGLVFAWNYFRNATFRGYLGIGQIDSLTSGRLRRRAPYSLMLVVLKRIFWLAIGIFLALAVTVSLVAAFITSPRIPPTQITETPLWVSLYAPVIFLIYDVGDLIGRWLPAIDTLAFTPKAPFVRWAPWLRFFLFVPLFVFIAPVSVSDGRTLPGDGGFGIRDILYAVVALLFGLTSGYCCTLVLMHAPALAVSQHTILPATDHQLEKSPPNQYDEGVQREACGALMGLFLNMGLLAGALSSFLWRFVPL